MNYRSFTCDFSTTAQFYDWNTNYSTQNSFSTDPARGAGGKPGSFRIDADFSKYKELTFTTSSVYFEGFADREVRFSVYDRNRQGRFGPGLAGRPLHGRCKMVGSKSNQEPST